MTEKEQKLITKYEHEDVIEPTLNGITKDFNKNEAIDLLKAQVKASDAEIEVNRELVKEMKARIKELEAGSTRLKRILHYHETWTLKEILDDIRAEDRK